jgi:hypothetical protein
MTALARHVLAAGSRVIDLPLFPGSWERALREWKWSGDARRALAVPRRPRTFNEKVRFKMASDRRPIIATLSDKVETRSYVERLIGHDVLTEVYLVTDDPSELRRERFPREVAIKAAHGSGGCVLISDAAPPDAALPEPPVGWSRFLVRPEATDWGRLRRLCAEWLSRRYATWEWGYRDLIPRILAEELLHGEQGVPWDYKLFTFHGRVRLVEVDVDRYGEIRRTLYTPDWELVPVRFKYPRGPEVERPERLDEMIEIAERLAGMLDFVRVDFFALGSRVVVGELTSYPGAGASLVDPPEFDAELGSWWSQPRRYR